MLLQPHPGSPRGPVFSFEVRGGRGAGRALQLSYRLHGDLSQLILPSAGKPAQADGLWRHTCFEAFIAVPGTPAYCELNFSPSGEWAAYGFTSYRTGMTPLRPAAAPAARWRQGADHVELTVTVPPGGFVPGAGSGPLRLALAAVIEEQSGTISYWALRHPPGKPDFHHPESFALELPAAVAEGTATS